MFCTRVRVEEACIDFFFFFFGMLSNHLKSTIGTERTTVVLQVMEALKTYTKRKTAKKKKKRAESSSSHVLFSDAKTQLQGKKKKKKKSIVTFTATSNSLLSLPFCTGVRPPHRETSVREEKWMQPEGTPPLIFVCLLEDYS